MKSIYDYSIDSFTSYFLSIGEKKYRARQIIEAIYQKKVNSFDEITNINKDAIARLKNDFYFSCLELVKTSVALDETTKFLFKLEDNNLIETVLMKQTYGYSVCVTSQVGCNMGCLFCASGETKKIRNLTPSEMVMQVLEVANALEKEDKRLSHVVVMGIGEPFDNYDNLIEFIKIINEPFGLAIGARHITISTCGIVPRIIDFSDFPLQVNLAISLHFPNDELRNKYMPVNRKYNLSELFKALDIYYKKTNRRLTFEYILLDNVNDSLECAKELVSLIKGINAYVNLIPYNETDHGLKRSLDKKRDEFFNYLISHHVNAFIRKEHGGDIDAACGQLRVKTDPSLKVKKGKYDRFNNKSS